MRGCGTGFLGACQSSRAVLLPSRGNRPRRGGASGTELGFAGGVGREARWLGGVGSWWGEPLMGAGAGLCGLLLPALIREAS